MMISLLALVLMAQGAGPVAVDKLPFDPTDLKALEAKAEIRVVEEGKTIVYGGLPLASILEKRSKDLGAMSSLRALSDAVLLVRGTDGYQAAVSAAAVAMDPRGERYFLATRRDGQPLGEAQGPVRLIVPGDPKHARWVRNVATIRLVRLDKLE